MKATKGPGVLTFYNSEWFFHQPPCESFSFVPNIMINTWNLIFAPTFIYMLNGYTWEWKSNICQSESQSFFFVTENETINCNFDDLVIRILLMYCKLLDSRYQNLTECLLLSTWSQCGVLNILFRKISNWSTIFHMSPTFIVAVCMWDIAKILDLEITERHSVYGKTKWHEMILSRGPWRCCANQPWILGDFTGFLCCA